MISNSKLDVRLLDYVDDVALLQEQIFFRVHNHVGELVTVVCVSIFDLFLWYAKVAHSIAYQIGDLLPFDLDAYLLILGNIVTIDDRISRASQLLDRTLLGAIDAWV